MVEMKVVYIAINSKYIHTNRAVRLLSKISSQKFASSFKEFTIKDSIDSLVNYLIINCFCVVGFSVYLWNVEMVLKVATLLKEKNPKIIIILGGPEVSYDTSTFINNPSINYVIAHEGEEIILSLLEKIYNREEVCLEGVATKQNPFAKPLRVQHLHLLPSILDLYSEDDLKNRIIYLETSRGCPYRCQYCLSSLEQGVSNFDLNQVFSEIRQFVDAGAKHIKFLDRTMNVSNERFMEIMKYIESLPTTQSFQFEVVGNIIDEKLLNYLMFHVSKNKFRLELGVQSTNEESNLSVDRYQNNEYILQVISQMVSSNRVLVHADLIAGLPYETLECFSKTFNELFSTHPHELQLGFLKLLRGTKLWKNAKEYGYIFDPHPPYEVYQSNWMSEKDFQHIHIVEQSLEIFWNKNRAPKTILTFLKKNLMTSFELFYYLGTKLKEKRIHEAADYYEILYEIVKEDELLVDCIKEEYLNRHFIRPRRFWKNEIMMKEMKTQLLTHSTLTPVILDNAFLTKTSYGFLVVIYQNKGKEIKKIVV